MLSAGKAPKYLNILYKSNRLRFACLKYFHWLISWKKWSFNTPALIFAKTTKRDGNSRMRMWADLRKQEQSLRFI